MVTVFNGEPIVASVNGVSILYGRSPVEDALQDMANLIAALEAQCQCERCEWARSLTAGGRH